MTIVRFLQMQETQQLIAIDAAIVNKKRSSDKQRTSYHLVRKTARKMMKESRVLRIRLVFSCFPFGKARKDDDCKLAASTRSTPSSPLSRTKGSVPPAVSDTGVDDTNLEDSLIIFSDSSDLETGLVLPNNLMNHHFPVVGDLEPAGVEDKTDKLKVQQECHRPYPKQQIGLSHMRQTLKKLWRGRQNKNLPLSSKAECEASGSDCGDADFDTRSAHFSVSTDLNEVKSPKRNHHWGSALLSTGCQWSLDQEDAESVEVGWPSSPTKGVGCTSLKDYLEWNERKAQDVVEFGEINVQDSKSVCSAILDVSFAHRDECAQLVLKPSSSAVSTSSLSFSNEQDEVFFENEGTLGASFSHPDGKSSLFMETFHKAASPSCATPPTRRAIARSGRKWVEGTLEQNMEARSGKMKNGKHKDSHRPSAIAIALSVATNDNDDGNTTNDEGPSDFDNNTSDLGWSFSHDDDSIMTFTSLVGEEIFKPTCRYASDALLLDLPIFRSPKKLVTAPPPCQLSEDDNTPLTMATSSSSSTTRTPEDMGQRTSPRHPLGSPPTLPPVIVSL
jgi:hypothetical protein